MQQRGPAVRRGGRSAPPDPTGVRRGSSRTPPPYGVTLVDRGAVEVVQLYTPPDKGDIASVSEYTSGKLSMATKESGRLPSLYFTEDDETSRARQMHRSGPTLTRWRPWSEYFFPDKAKMGAAAATARKLGSLDATSKATWEADAAKNQGMKRSLIEGGGHLQIRWHGKAPGRGNPHSSGGTAHATTGLYDDDQTRYIAAAVFYNAGDKDEKAAKADLNPKNPAKWRA